MTLKELQELIAGEASEAVIGKLKGGRKLPSVDEFRKQYEVSDHVSLDKTKRPDKAIKKEDGEIERYEKVNRIGIALQELITERAVSFLFGSPVKIVADPQTEQERNALKAFNRVLKDVKIDSFNAEVALEMFRSTEVAECWFPVERPESHADYGFNTQFKLRVTAFQPWNGDELYPLFDETGDLIAFSRAYKLTDDDGKSVNYFETYTASEKIVWRQASSAWEEVSRAINTIGKIPVVYGRQEKVEWANVQALIDRLEWLLSNYADTVDYHGSPTIFIQGKLTGFAKKGESGKIIEGEQGATAEYLSWQHAPEAVKLEIESLLRFIYSLTQTPDISFDAVKGLGEISGVALRMLFLDAHLKVKKKQRVFDAYLERRTNIIKAFLGMMATSMKASFDALEIEAQIQPFIVDDQKDLIDRLTTANGGKPLISTKTATALSGLVENADEEYAQIQAESAEERAIPITEPTF